jgi:nickel-dependent lactate racemase
MKLKFTMALALILASSTTLFAGVAGDVGKAAKKTAHVSAVAAKDTAHVSEKAATKTGGVTKDVAKGTLRGGKDVAHGTKKATAKTVDVLK